MIAPPAGSTAHRNGLGFVSRPTGAEACKVTVSIRLTVTERAALTRVAALAGMTLSDFLRKKILAAP